MNVSEWALIQYTGRRHWQDRIMMKVIAASQGIYDSTSAAAGCKP